MAFATADTLFLNTIFSAALEKKASDIHLIAGNYPVFRLDTKLYVLAEQKILTVDAVSAIVDAVLTEEEKQRLLSEREVRTVYLWADRARFRTSVYYQHGYPALSFRLIPHEVADPKTLGIPDVLVDMIMRPSSLTIVSGPFNSGRSTTIASLLQHVNLNANKRIVTLERPIEYLLLNNKSIINQREVGKDTPSFTHGLRDVFDEDVDLVVVSDIAESGVTELMLNLAESGKTVIGVMNAMSSISALEQIVDSVPRDRRHWVKDSLAEIMKVVVNQRLVPSVSSGRILAFEVLTMTRSVSAILQEDKYSQLANVMQTSREEGMVSLDVRLSELARQGKISADEARKYALDPASIRV